MSLKKLMGDIESSFTLLKFYIYHLKKENTELKNQINELSDKIESFLEIHKKKKNLV